ncbi:similar to alr0113 (ycf52) [Synechococcus elongatus PCC 6301]|uniref:Similar to alr0113 (Ycf52) n=1 Tax=Synechococcus sp. (strain ATCC 27144 / PCC 6301 / SAUG 1402/1) TaxID=269084 RepID=A0A0H3K477_SYNP6|nr:similar to alr0113 (ycf52) [Synechococcus elongatus PCC 6301]
MTQNPLVRDRSRLVRVRVAVGEVTGDELNQLLVLCDQPRRNLQKWAIALDHTFVCVTARLLSDRTLIGFVRATSDESLNATIWDLLVDPLLPEPENVRQRLLDILLRELKREIPGCSVSVFAPVPEQPALRALNFVPDPGGIRGMTYTGSQQLELSDANSSDSAIVTVGQPRSVSEGSLTSMEGFEPPTLRTGI